MKEIPVKGLWLLCEGVNQNREILGYEKNDSKKKNHSCHSDHLLVSCHILLSRIIAIAPAALNMLPRHIRLLWFREVTIFLSTFLCFRVVETRTVIELPDLLLTKKAEIKSHISFKFLYVFQFAHAMRALKSKFTVFYLHLCCHQE